MIVPFFEKGVRVNLEREIPGWRSTSREKLLEQVRLRIRLQRKYPLAQGNK
jgi:hypothetical protein